jgi:phage shock protein A
MRIITRLIQLFKADIHSVIDRLEDKRVLLKQYFRDMEDALEQKEAQLKKLRASRTQIQREEEKYTHEIETLEKELKIAIHKNKDDIARLLIKKIKSLSSHREELRNYLEILKYRISQLENCIAEQRLRYKQLRLRAEEYFRKEAHEKWTKIPLPVLPFSSIREPSEEEVELELLQLKETIKEGVRR